MRQKESVEITNANILASELPETFSESVSDIASIAVHDTPGFDSATDFAEFAVYSPEKMHQMYNSCIKTAGQAQYLYSKLRGAEKAYNQLQIQCNENAAHIIAMQSDIAEQKAEIVNINSKLEGKDLQVLELENLLRKVQESKNCAEDRVEALALQITQYREHILSKEADCLSFVSHVTTPALPSNNDEDWVAVNRKSKSASSSPSKVKSKQSSMSYKEKLLANPFAPLLSLKGNTHEYQSEVPSQNQPGQRANLKGKTLPAYQPTQPSSSSRIQPPPPPRPPFKPLTHSSLPTPPPTHSTTPQLPPPPPTLSTSIQPSPPPPRQVTNTAATGRFHNRSLCAVGIDASNEEATRELQIIISHMTKIPINDMQCFSIRNGNTLATRILFRAAKAAALVFSKRKDIKEQLDIRICEDLSPTERVLKRSRAMRFKEELSVPNQWVQWRRADIFVCQVDSTANVESVDRKWNRIVDYNN